MRISIDNWVLLWRKQKRLQEIEVDATDLPLMPIIEKDPNLIKAFKDVPVLSLYPAELDGLRVCQKIFRTPVPMQVYLAGLCSVICSLSMLALRLY